MPGRNAALIAHSQASVQVLLINQFFWPDTAATGQLLTDVTREIDPECPRGDGVVREVRLRRGGYGLPAASEDCAVWAAWLFQEAR